MHNETATADAAPILVALLGALERRRTDPNPRPTTNKREFILEVARQLMIEKGMAALTIRGVARAAGMSPGNLGYHFPSYDALVDELLKWVLTPYLEEFDRLRDAAGGTPLDRLRAVMNFVLEDLANRDTTLFFPELWVLANRDDNAKHHMEKLYTGYVGALEELIREARRDLSDEAVTNLAWLICATIEGQTVFVGAERPQAARRDALRELTLNTLVRAVVEA
ncbi:MAG: TetR/AcrR family transcriptional regulator [Pseudomonadota bacterium]